MRVASENLPSRTKLKTNPSRGAPQLCDDSCTLSMVDNAGEGEEEWEVEEICHGRKLDGGGLEFQVKWKRGTRHGGLMRTRQDGGACERLLWPRYCIYCLIFCLGCVMTSSGTGLAFAPFIRREPLYSLI